MVRTTENVTRVYDLRTGEIVAIYTCMPEEAVRCAFAQFEKKDFNTWDYENKYPIQYGAAKASVSCGDYAAIL